jgi:hypothetical protein
MSALEARSAQPVKRSSMDTHYFHGGEPQNHHSRHSVGPEDLNAVLRTAEPREAADIAGLLSVSWLAFLSEDYCSNYEVMLCGLVAPQRPLSSWPLYETGVEALTRSIRAIDHRRGSNKRAIAVGDLLMLPIQRLTKYTLLFSDLH